VECDTAERILVAVRLARVSDAGATVREVGNSINIATGSVSSSFVLAVGKARLFAARHVGKGYRYSEFRGFNVDQNEADARFEESLEVLDLPAPDLHHVSMPLSHSLMAEIDGPADRREGRVELDASQTAKSPANPSPASRTPRRSRHR
jgi:hypothetical protein